MPVPALVAQHGLHLVEGVGDPARELLAASVLLQEVKPELIIEQKCKLVNMTKSNLKVLFFLVSSM